MGSAVLQGQLWGGAPRDWAAIQEGMAWPLWVDVLRAAGAGTGVSLLDAGCGAGGASVEATRLGCAVTGVDASAPLLAVARKRVPDARFEEGDLEALPLDDGTFDVVLAVNSVIFAADMVRAMRELVRVTRSGGRVLVTTWGKPEDCEMAPVQEAIVGTLPHKPPGGGPFALSVPGALEALLEKAGLRPVERGETRCDFRYPSLEIAWRGAASSGPVQGAIKTVGESAVRPAFEAAVRRFVDAAGAVTIRNKFVWVASKRG